MEPNDGSAPEDPRDAGKPRTKGVTRAYETDEIRVLWDATRCTHVATCLNALPEVFDVRRRPWIDITGASAQEIAETVRLCPTGALRYEALAESVRDEQPDQPTTVEIRPNGPLVVRGCVKITGARGEVVTEETRVSLCRCGGSENMPFCDNSHRAIGFRG
jgi:uncharacterized Fe-S cluster protein YjdI